MKKILTLLFMAFNVSCTPAHHSQGMPLEQWAHNHPKASEALGEWVKSHPKVARDLFEWDSNHPERSQEFVEWCTTHGGEKINVFVNQHPNWGTLDIFAENHRPAMEQFMFWCRDYPEAAKTLMMHKNGLAWAGNHLYREYWNMETPRK